MNKKFLVVLLTLFLSLLIVGCQPGATIKLSQSEIKLYVGEMYDVYPVVTGVEGNDAVIYAVEDPTIVSVDDNIITALSVGETNVIASLKDYPEQKAILKVIVEEEPQIIVTGSNVYIGCETQFDAQLIGIEGTVEWSSDNETVATVDQNGVVTGKQLGGAAIIAQVGDYKGMIEIVVKRQPQIIISGDTEVIVGGSGTVSASLRNLEGTIEWLSSDESIATIDQSGNIKGVAEGKVTITAKVGEFTETYEVTVATAKIVVSGPQKVYVGEEIQLIAEVKGAIANDVTFKWISSDGTVGEVNNGKVKGISEGEVTINVSWNGMDTDYVVEVAIRRELTIEGFSTVDMNDTTQLSVSTLNLEGTVIWSSSDESVAKVDANGVVTGVKLGTATITAKIGEVSSTFEIKVIAVTDKVTYNFNGGSSKELYASENAIASFSLTSYNNNSGSFWGGGYSSNVYISTPGRETDPGATFSDRIYIGKNKYTGYYEIKSILTSGTSSWAEGAEYVITISTSYSSYRTIHAEVLKLNVGDIAIIFTEDITKISQSNKAVIGFYGTEIKGYQVVVQKADFDGKLIEPVKLGYEFLGWYDSTGKKYESLSKDQISGNIKLSAKWNQLNPVIDIKVNNIPNEMETGDEFQIVATVNPTNAFFTQILYSTTNEDIVSVTKEGYLKAINTGSVTITLTDFIGEVVQTYEITVNEIPSIDIQFPSNYNGVLKVNETLQLEPSYLGKSVDNLSYTYTSNNTTVATVDASGLVKAISQGDAVITIKSSNGKELPIGVAVYGSTESDRVEEVINLLIENSHAEVEVGNACLYNDGTNRVYDSMYGSVNYYLFEEFKVNRKYEAQAEATGSHYGVRSQSDIQFVTVHDTATLSGTGDSMAKNLSTSTSVSIHYVVGNGEVFSNLPEKYMAWHAGDGNTRFEWLPTGVAGQEGVQPEFDMIKDGNTYYFTINGLKTTVVCPVSNGNRTIQNPSKAHFAELGPTWKVVNGQYYIGKPWVNFGQNVSGVICSRGGNLNSVGIEMCMNTAGDIYDSYQRNAQLVADILIRNNLDLTRVKQHNTFDGKNCPQVILAGNYWGGFMKMVEINYILGKDYSDAKISMVSDNPDIVAHNGRVINYPSVATTVGYTITVTIGSTTKSIKLYSVVPGTTSWEKWDGTYPSSLIWNNGNFVVNK